MNLLEKDAPSYRRNLEKEFYKTFEKFLWLNQLFCAVPIRLSVYLLGTENSRTFKGKVLDVSHLLYGLLVCGCVCFATYLLQKDFDSSMDFMTRILLICQYLMAALNMLLVIIGCHYQRRFYSVFFRRLLNIDMNLQAACGIQPNFDATRINLKKMMISFVAFFGTVITVDFMYNHMSGDNFIRSSTVYTTPNLVSTLALMQHAAVVCLLCDKLKTINAALKNMASCSESRDHCQTVNGKLVVFSVLSMNSDLNKCHFVRSLRRQHDEVCRLIELLNKCFGLLIVLTLASASVVLCSLFYQIYKMPEDFEAPSVWLVLYFILWIILHVGKVILVLYPMNDFVDEQRRTGYLIFKVGIKKKNPLNDDVTRELKIFADQLLHERTPPNALRIINLDMNLTGTMVGTLATYLIILIQFDENTGDKTPKN